MARRILLDPLIPGYLAGIGAAHWTIELPGPVNRIIDYLAVAAAPCALFTLGVKVSGRPLNHLPEGVVPNMILKLLAHPIIVFIALTFSGFTGVWLHTAVLIASLPTALGVYIIASQMRIETDSVSSITLPGTCLSVLTVSGQLYLIEANILP